MNATIRHNLRSIPLLAVLLLILGHPAWAETTKPNILVTWGDDIGQFNISAYNHRA